MKNIPLSLMLAAVLGSPLPSNPFTSHSEAAQRSAHQYSLDYLCEVKVDIVPTEKKPRQQLKPKFPGTIRIEKPPRKHLKNAYKDGTLNVYFTTNSDTLYNNDLKDIRTYLKSLPPGTRFLLEGYADFRGPFSYNLELSRKRGDGIANLIRNYVRNPRIQIAAYGEEFSQPEGTPVRKLGIDRRVSIIPDQTVITRGLEQFTANYYLIDQSASMSETIAGSSQTKWEEVLAYKFPAGSRVYTFTTTNRPCDTRLKDEKPTGRTPLFFSLQKLVERAEQSKNITVLTDGINNIPGLPDDVISIARQKKIKISFIGLDLPFNYELELVRIANGTGGRVYLQSR